jgi:hypothetical protein
MTVFDLIFSERSLAGGIKSWSQVKVNKNVEEHIASIFRVEDYVKQEISMKTYPSKMSDLRQITWHYIAEDRTVLNYICSVIQSLLGDTRIQSGTTVNKYFFTL